MTNSKKSIDVQRFLSFPHRILFFPLKNCVFRISSIKTQNATKRGSFPDSRWVSFANLLSDPETCLLSAVESSEQPVLPPVEEPAAPVVPEAQAPAPAPAPAPVQVFQGREIVQVNLQELAVHENIDGVRAGELILKRSSTSTFPIYSCSPSPGHNVRKQQWLRLRPE